MSKTLTILFAISLIYSVINPVQKDSGEYILVIQNKKNELFDLVMGDSINEKNISATLTIYRKKYLKTKKIDKDSIIKFEPSDPKTYDFYSLKKSQFSKKINSEKKRVDLNSISEDKIKFITTLYVYVKMDEGYSIYEMKLNMIE